MRFFWWPMAKTTRTQEQKHTFQYSFTVPKRMLSKIMVLAGFGLLEDCWHCFGVKLFPHIECIMHAICLSLHCVRMSTCRFTYLLDSLPVALLVKYETASRVGPLQKAELRFILDIHRIEYTNKLWMMSICYQNHA